jgi:hypothetical protein
MVERSHGSGVDVLTGCGSATGFSGAKPGPKFIDPGGLRGSPNCVKRDTVQLKVAGRGQNAIADRLSHH